MKTFFNLMKISLSGITLIIFTIFLPSCAKETLPSPEQSIATKDLSAPPDFDWKTYRNVTLNVTGLKEVNPEVTNTLYINSASGVTFYKDRLAMNQDYTLTFAVPATETSLVLIYGSKTKTLDIAAGTLTFDYITE